MAVEVNAGLKTASDEVVCTFQRESLAAGIDLPLPERDFYGNALP